MYEFLKDIANPSTGALSIQEVITKNLYDGIEINKIHYLLTP
jgi:hypothetical protein